MKNFFILLLTCFTCLVTAGQEEATTRSGKKVILYPDGSWKYADQAITKPAVTEKAPVKNKKPVTTSSQEPPADCAERLEITDDQKTGLRITKAKNLVISEEKNGKGMISFSMQKNSKGIITLHLYPVGAGSCIGEGNKVNIEFIDGSKSEFGHDGYANCSGETIISFGGNFGRKKQLESLQTKKIKKIKIWTQEGSVQQNLSTETQESLVLLFNCFVL